MQAEIICVGTELLLGDIADTNTQYLARRLSSLGIDLFYSTTVGDNRSRLVDALTRGLKRSDFVLTTGGLGPTEDDVTREAIAEVVGEDLMVDDQLAADLRTFFNLRGLEMTENNLKQASLIPSARSVPNSRGTAPGWWVEKGGRTVIAMPGPPGELHRMWEGEVEPALQLTDSVIESHTLKLFAISESRVDELLRPLTPSSNPTVAVYAKQDGIHVRITAKAPDRAMAVAAIRPVEDQVRKLLADSLWGTGDETQEQVTMAMLRQRGLTLALAESSTAGQLALMLSGAPDAAGVFRGSRVLPDSPRQASDLESLARRAACEFGADVGLATGGTPTPDSEMPMHDVYISIVYPSASAATTQCHRSRPFRVKTLGSYYAMHELRHFVHQIDQR
ncbi:MAG: CinA family nicotinamide mononucleotide deamidase-related protein [Chloroflexota bacterium]